MPPTRPSGRIPSRFVRTASADDKGRFRISGLPPAERYLAVATDYLEDGEHYDPEFLERMRDAATPFSLDDAETPCARTEGAGDDERDRGALSLLVSLLAMRRPCQTQSSRSTAAHASQRVDPLTSSIQRSRHDGRHRRADSRRRSASVDGRPVQPAGHDQRRGPLRAAQPAGRRIQADRVEDRVHHPRVRSAASVRDARRRSRSARVRARRATSR